MAVELFVGRWILFGLRQRMAISSAIAAARMSAAQVCARAAATAAPRCPPRARATFQNDHLHDSRLSLTLHIYFGGAT